MTVDLPEPVGPTRNTNSPRSIANVALVEADVAAVVELRDAAELDDRRGAAARLRARAARHAGWAARRAGLVLAAAAIAAVEATAMRSAQPGRSIPAGGLAACKRRAAWPLAFGVHARDLHLRRSPTACRSTGSQLEGTRAVDRARRLRRRRPHRAPRGERHGPLPRAPRVQGRREVRRPTATSTRRPSASARRSTRTRSHDLVAFHITARAEARAEAIDLLTDFVGRPRIDAEELDRERGVVIQEIARAHDQPADGRRAPDRPGRLRRPPARPPGARPRGAPAHVHPRGDRRLSRAPLVGPRAAARSSSATSTRCPTTARSTSCSPASRTLPEPPALRAGAAARAARCSSSARDSNQSHLRMSYRPVDRRVRSRARAALTIYATLLGGSMGSRLFDEIREQRGLAYSVYALDHAFADVADAPALGRAGVGQDASRPTSACGRSSTELRDRRARPRRRSSAPAPTPPARRVLAFENTNAVARHARARVDRVRRGDRPRRGDRRAWTRSPTTRSPRSRAGVGERARRRLRRPARRGGVRLDARRIAGRCRTPG